MLLRISLLTNLQKDIAIVLYQLVCCAAEHQLRLLHDPYTPQINQYGACLNQDILRVLYPHALDKELAEMLSVVIPKRHVKGQNNLEQQVAELKEVFAVYDEDGTGQLAQATFVEAIVSAG